MVVGSSGNDVSIGNGLFSAFKSMSPSTVAVVAFFLSSGQVVNIVSKNESRNLVVSFRHE